jgi:hypothetical protein
MSRPVITLIGMMSSVYLLFCGCVNENTVISLNQIDSVYRIIKLAEDKLHEVNPDSIQVKYGLYKKYAALIDEHYSELKNTETWPYICAYRNVRKPFKNMYTNYHDLQLEIDSSGVRLEGLKYDVKKELLDRNQFNAYYVNEKKGALSLLNKVTMRVDLAKRELINFDTVHPKIVSFIDRLGHAEHKH